MTTSQKVEIIAARSFTFQAGNNFRATEYKHTLRISDNDAVAEHDKGYSNQYYCTQTDCVMMLQAKHFLT
ncbi:MAG: hypothetical protein K2P74_03395 [Nitrosomonas sp.]|nr:hypothetical protein [Nitrosomonas sp.]